MINEEGGVDPEQFRMEAMFDRMDAIGKSILGLTIQCAQCHNHKYDPMTQDEYYRMFAFLNNDARSHRRRLYARGADEAGRNLSARSRDRDTACGTQARLASSAWLNGKTHKAEHQPEWTVVQPRMDDISTGGERYLLQPDGSYPRARLCARNHRGKFTVKTDVQNITAFRLELLNDPNLPCGGPGRSINGTGALTEFEVEAAPADDRQERSTRSSSSKPPPIRESARDAAATPISTTRAGQNAASPADQFAIDGKDETAGASMRARAAATVPQSRLRRREAHRLSPRARF